MCCPSLHVGGCVEARCNAAHDTCRAGRCASSARAALVIDTRPGLNNNGAAQLTMSVTCMSHTHPMQQQQQCSGTRSCGRQLSCNRQQGRTNSHTRQSPDDAICKALTGGRPHRWQRRMRERSMKRVASKSSSVSIFHVQYRAIITAALSWSKPSSTCSHD
jgi:hypothetical protein